MRGGIFNSEIGFSLYNARAVPGAVIPAGYPGSYKFTRDDGRILPEKIPGKFFQPKRLRLKPQPQIRFFHSFIRNQVNSAFVSVASLDFGVLEVLF
jgi:hypothetical protein